jgi:uncharacterized cupin superfamily protein
MVMSGEVRVRTPSGVESGRPGDLFCFPIGAEGAHCAWNEAEQPARIVMFSSAAEPAIAVYPDGGKVGVWSGDEHDHWMFRGAEAHLDYYDGEIPPKR